MEFNARNISAYIYQKYIASKAAIVAGSGTDNSEVTGATIDLSTMDYPLGVTLTMSALVSLAASKTAKLTVKIETSADGTNWDTAVTVIDGVTVATGALTASGVIYTKDLNLTAYAKKFIRFKTTMDLDATGTDTAEYQIVGLFASKKVPA